MKLSNVQDFYGRFEKQMKYSGLFKAGVDGMSIVLIALMKRDEVERGGQFCKINYHSNEYVTDCAATD